MTTPATQELLSFFVCGTPTDKGGFELVELGPSPLPGTPSHYLDRGLAHPEQTTHDVQSLVVDGARYIRYVQSQPINPSDSASNRGAYLSVGFMSATVPTLHVAANCIAFVSETAGRVRAHLDANTSFPPGFRLQQLSYGSPLTLDLFTHFASPLLLSDLLLQAANRKGQFDQGRESCLLTTREMQLTAGDFPFYTDDNVEAAIQSLEDDRVRIGHLAEASLEVAAFANDQRRNWQDFESNLQQALEAAALASDTGQRLLDKLAEHQRRVKRISQELPSPSTAQGAGEWAEPAHSEHANRMAPREKARTVWRALASRGGSSDFRYVKAAAAAALLAVAVIAIAFFIPEDTVEQPPPYAATAVPDGQVSTKIDSPTAETPAQEVIQSDVVRERSALDEIPDRDALSPDPPEDT